MTPAPVNIAVRCVESPALPPRVPFYSLRRELRGITPPAAFWFGVLAGVGVMGLVWIVAIL
jgi:hypothetical protein